MMMKLLMFTGAILFLLLGHFFKIVRWEKFIGAYEQPPTGTLSKSLAIGYALNFLVPFRVGELVRAVYAGRRLKNGIGFSLATVILDRFLDVVAVTVIFIGFYLCGVRDSRIAESAEFYLAFTLLLLLGLIVLRVCSGKIKRIAQRICGIFNDSIKLAGLKFFWTLINTFRDIWRVRLSRILINSVLIWSSYMISYYMLAVCLSEQGAQVGLEEVFVMLFSKSSLDVSSISLAALWEKMISGQQLIVAAYMLLPVLVLFGVTVLPDRLKVRIKHLAGVGTHPDQSKNVLPQLRDEDQLQFLDSYFCANDSQSAKRFIEMNRNVSIIRDYSAGSNATTMLCMNDKGMFYRKYAFGADGDKLKQQVDWLRAHEAQIPLCGILFEDSGEGYCCYDMVYDQRAVGMFRYMHSHPEQKSWQILNGVLDKMRSGLYSVRARKADAETIRAYINSKVVENLKTIKGSPVLKSILGYDTVVINGVPYKNLNQLEHLFAPEYLEKVFEGDLYSDIHGDLTIENIICLEDAAHGDSFYIIDPNTGNLHDSQFLDYGKLLQSLHAGYEFMMMTNSVFVSGNHIDFLYTKSGVYDTVFGKVREYLHASFPEEDVVSIFHHELVHWLRLMPYKLRKDKERAAMFYAGLIMVANDVDAWYGKK